MDETLSDTSPNKYLRTPKTEKPIRFSELVSKIEKAKTTSRRSQNHKDCKNETAKKYRKTPPKLKKTSASEKTLSSKYSFKKMICAGLVGAVAGFALNTVY